MRGDQRHGRPFCSCAVDIYMYTCMDSRSVRPPPISLVRLATAGRAMRGARHMGCVAARWMRERLVHCTCSYMGSWVGGDCCPRGDTRRSKSSIQCAIWTCPPLARNGQVDDCTHSTFFLWTASRSRSLRNDMLSFHREEKNNESNGRWHAMSGSSSLRCCIVPAFP